MRLIKHHSELPWLCAGDFNEILFEFEKEGGAPKPQSQMDKFRETLEDCGLHDLGFQGDPFTWRNNSHCISTYIKERLDRAVATIEWCNHFPNYRVINGDPGHSDHRPIIIYVHEERDNFVTREESRTFHFEARWLEEEKCDEVVHNA